ncbi:MAG: type II 3-dehydroquinate dehydratase [Rhodobacteraceae bacterium]|nr:type II 3-dehydroquinate dehydratase [Paracoccaceae bacterium]
MSLPVLLLNGPNLNLLGQREPALYGATTLPEIEAEAVALGRDLGLEVRCAQSNHEGALIDLVQEARGVARAIIINPGGYSHTSVALLDALSAFEGPVVEVHISQIHRRESFRHRSYVSRRADAVIAGCGAQGYALALRHVAHLLSAG